MQHPLQLVHGGGPGKEGPADEKLREDAPGGPHVHPVRVPRGPKQDLRRPVPPGGNVVREDGGGALEPPRRERRPSLLGLHLLLPLVHLIQLGHGPGEAEVRQLHVAVAREQKVAGLQVPVQELRRVQELEGLEKLVHDVALVDVQKDVRPYRGVQVRLHVLEHQVDVPVVVRPQHVQQPNDVSVAAYLLQEHDFSKGALRVRGILKGVEDLLQGHNPACLPLHGLPNDPIRALAQLLLDVVLLQHVGVDLLRHVVVHTGFFRPVRVVAKNELAEVERDPTRAPRA